MEDDLLKVEPSGLRRKINFVGLVLGVQTIALLLVAGLGLNQVWNHPTGRIVILVLGTLQLATMGWLLLPRIAWQRRVLAFAIGVLPFWGGLLWVYAEICFSPPPLPSSTDNY